MSYFTAQETLLVRMLEAGEDPLYIARRLMRMAAEDIGLADPQALRVMVDAMQGAHFMRMPEGNLALAEAAVYLALALTSAVPLCGTEAPLPLALTVTTGDDIPLVAAWSPDGQRLAYATDKEVKERGERHYRGEVWVTDLAGKQKRIVKEDFLRGFEAGATFRIEALAWAPDGTRLAVEVLDAKKKPGVFLFTDQGQEVELGSSDTNGFAGYGAAWLGDNQTLGALAETAEPRVLQKIFLVRVAGGLTIPLFAGRVFSAVAWLAGQPRAVVVEQDPEYSRPPQLMLADLEKATLEPLGELASYLGGLGATPDEASVSYFTGSETLLVRPLGGAGKSQSLPIPFGRTVWMGTTGAVLFLEPEAPGERRGWLTRYDPAAKTKTRLLEEPIQNFWVAPDARHVAVLTAEVEAKLKIFRLPLP